MIKLIIGVGGGVVLSTNDAIGINVSKYKLDNYCVYWKSDAGTGLTRGAYLLSVYDNRIVFRIGNTIPETLAQATIVCALFGNFNFDTLSIYASAGFTGRIEIRNENDVLITDNGKPWGDGTYPPDAKNRAGLAGLHAAPAVINPELDTALMGDETDKERLQE